MLDALDTLAVFRKPGRWLVVLNRLGVADIKQVVRRGRVLIYNENAREKIMIHRLGSGKPGGKLLPTCRAVVLIACAVGCWLAGDVSLSAGTVDFAHDVVPLLKKHCVECHGGHESKGGFSFNTRELVMGSEVISVGQAGESRMIELVLSEDPEAQMPPRDRPRLAAAEVQLLRAWVDQGLAWEPGFSFAPQHYEPPLLPRRPELPPAIDGRHHPVDRIVDHYLALHKVPRPAPVNDGQFMRRLYLDLIGLPPSTDALIAFVADSSYGKREALVERVLKMREPYATHWLSFWNDLLRNDYSGPGFIDAGRKQITSWLYESLMHNMPYDQFVRELISPSPRSEGFIRGIKWRGNVNASQKRDLQFSQNITQVFLGINMKCASCHDSFIDRWTLEETYSLAAVYATEDLELHRCDKPLGRMAAAAWIFPELGEIDSSAPQSERLEQLAALMIHPDNGRLQRTIVNRLWHRLMGHGIVHPIDAMHTPPWSADLLDFLGVYLTENNYDLKRVIHLIVTSSAYQSETQRLDQQPGVNEYLYGGPLARRMTAEQFLDTLWSITGTWPEPDKLAFMADSRQQGGQLKEILMLLRPGAFDPDADTLSADGTAKKFSRPKVYERWRVRWHDRPVRAAFRPLDPFQASLGRPSRDQVVSSRPSQVTTLEAIALSNDPYLAELFVRGAANVLDGHHGPSEALIERIFLAALSRQPTPVEKDLAVDLIGPEPSAQSVEDLLWSIVMLPEFQWIR
jgi:hypothetical protein